MRLQDKIAIVTGSSMGIGEAIAKRFAKEGATVAVNYFKSPEAAGTVVQNIESNGGRAKAYRAMCRTFRRSKGLPARSFEISAVSTSSSTMPVSFARFPSWRRQKKSGTSRST